MMDMEHTFEAFRQPTLDSGLWESPEMDWPAIFAINCMMANTQDINVHRKLEEQLHQELCGCQDNHGSLWAIFRG